MAGSERACVARVACVCACALLLRLQLTVAGEPDDNDTPKLRYYYSGLEHYTELPLQEAERVLALPAPSSWYNESRTTLLFVHGFTGGPEGLAVGTVVAAYLGRGDCNVALLNWRGLAAPVADTLAGSYLNWAAPNARKLGVQLAGALRRLAGVGLALQRTHLVGHSLGAHVLGVAGNTLRAHNITLPWITGLDPASVGFENKPEAARLHAGSAAAVAVLHSDPGGYGLRRAAGHIDFWPNYRGGPHQPGCPDGPHPRFSPEDLCDHNRSWQLLAEAARRPGSLRARRAKNYRAWKAKPDPHADTADLDAYGKPLVLRSLDVDGSKHLNKKAFLKAIKLAKLDISDEDKEALFAQFDLDGTGSMSIDEFIKQVRPPMSEGRRQIVTQAFRKLDKTGEGAVSVQDLRGIYSVDNDPRYKSGEESKELIMGIFLANFDTAGVVNGKVTLEEFMNYYSGIGVSIEDDCNFDLVMRQCYKL